MCFGASWLFENRGDGAELTFPSLSTICSLVGCPQMERWEFQPNRTLRSKDAFLFAITNGVMLQLESKISLLKQRTQHCPERRSCAELENVRIRSPGRFIAIVSTSAAWRTPRTGGGGFGTNAPSPARVATGSSAPWTKGKLQKMKLKNDRNEAVAAERSRFHSTPTNQSKIDPSISSSSLKSSHDNTFLLAMRYVILAASSRLKRVHNRCFWSYLVLLFSCYFCITYIVF